MANREKFEFSLKKIEIYGLFGIYDYDNLEFKTDDGILIIYGLNGMGKTTILNTIQFFKNIQYKKLSNIKFKKIKFKFVSGNSAGKILITEITKLPVDNLKIEFFYLNEKEPFFSNIFKVGFNPKDIVMINSGIFEGEKGEIMESNTYEIDSEELILKLESEDTPIIIKINKKYLDLLEKGQLDDDQLNDQNKKILEQFREGFKSYLITAKRLDIDDYKQIIAEEQRKSSIRRYQEGIVPVIQDIKSIIAHKSSILKEKIQDALDNYTMISQTQEKDLVKRIIDSIDSPMEYSYDEVFNELEAIESIQEAYKTSGLDTSEVSQKIDLLSPIKNSLNWSNNLQTQILYRILKEVIISDTKKKLEIFKELYQKISLFKEIVNDHLSKKLFKIDYKEGFTVINTITKDEINLELLSSGEKHLISLFFDLIFNIDPNTLVMIDEPEISLHVDWQVKFIKNLLRIKKSGIKDLEKIKFILTTHSPQIIHNRWDLAVNLTMEELS